MRIGIPAETGEGETRVAATPETIRKLLLAKNRPVIAETIAQMASQGLTAFAPETAPQISRAQSARFSEPYSGQELLPCH